MKQKVTLKPSFSFIASIMLAGATGSLAAPSGGVVTSGNATISQSGAVTNINQSSHKASINWQKFNIAKGETVNFNQPNSSSITLNRVIGNERSIINGALNANGQVWILNSSGVLFGKNARVNTSGLLATTKQLSDVDFQNGKYTFSGDSTASVINLGEIDIQNEGYASLLASTVSNEGTIKAVKGKVTLTGADKATINLNGNSLVKLTVDKGVLDALVENKGAIYADAGEVYLTTNSIDELLKGVVNNTGIIEANSIDDVTGYVELFAHGGEVKVAGDIQAKDGFVETSGKRFSIDKDTNIQAGHWLIDPTDITIDAAMATVLEGQLASGDATVETADAGAESGDINIESAINWAANTLILDADGDININAVLTASGTAGLDMTKGGDIYVGFNSDGTFKGRVDFTGTNTLVIDGNNYTIIGNDANALQNMAGNYNALGANVDVSSIANWNPLTLNASSYLNGLGHTVDAMTTDGVGFIGEANDNSIVSNIGVTNVNINSNDSSIGALVGNLGSNSKVLNSYSTGFVRQASTQAVTGGLVGIAYISSIIKNSYSSATVEGYNQVGGLVGASAGNIFNSYATGDVTGINSYTGGLVGNIGYGTISNSYATGDVNAPSSDYVGGLVGGFMGAVSINNSYATGDITGNHGTGGIVGQGDSGASVSNTYFTGRLVSSGNGVNGIVGQNIGNGTTITNSFYDKTIATGLDEEAIHGKTTAELKDIATFRDAGWNFNDIWQYKASVNNDNPVFQWQYKVPVIENNSGNSNKNPTLTSSNNTNTSNIQAKAKDVIKSITSKQVAKVEVPKNIVGSFDSNTPLTKVTDTPRTFRVPTTIGSKLNIQDGTQVSFVSSVGENNEQLQPVSLQEIQQIMEDGNEEESKKELNQQLVNNINETRIPISQNSRVELVNGGVKLPVNVQQEFYIVRNIKK